ncbi:MAG: NAD-dependent epimerase/dehydratase family protein [Alphaproteobacteria bacterium]|nr:NAD-dependent epimerase/dehydratase family protein [Alphaproteobacteria bacterium]
MRALITGANGHVGYNLCAALAADGGYDVRASVRTLDDPARVDALRGLGDIELVALDIRDPAAFEPALEGVDVLFHVAATYQTIVDDGGAEAMLADSVEGAAAALRAAASKGVRKVVFTSSVVTLPMVPRGAPPATEADWTDDVRIPYFRAKVEGERTAWRLAEALGVEMAAVLPAGVGGPGFTRRTPTIALIEGILLGSMRFGAPHLNFSYVDARDLAQGFLLAARPGVTGRFVLANDTQPDMVEWARTLREVDADCPGAPWVLPGAAIRAIPFLERLNERFFGVPRFTPPEGGDTVIGKVVALSNARARSELGWAPAHSFAESLADTAVAIRALRRGEGHTRLA